MAQTSAQKLGIKPGMRVRVEGAVPDAARDHAGAPAESAAASGMQADLLLFYAETVEDVAGRASTLFGDVAPDGRFWIAYRKGATRRNADGPEPLHRDSLQRILGAHGLEGVTLIALDDTWSAMRVKRARG